MAIWQHCRVSNHFKELYFVYTSITINPDNLLVWQIKENVLYSTVRLRGTYGVRTMYIIGRPTPQPQVDRRLSGESMRR